jgi:hypothetical protein
MAKGQHCASATRAIGTQESRMKDRERRAGRRRRERASELAPPRAGARDVSREPREASSNWFSGRGTST